MKKKHNSMREHLLLPLLILLIIQTVLIIVVVLYGGVSKKLKSNAIRILNENSENSRLYLEKETIHRWMGFVSDSSSVAGQIQAILNESGRKSSDIRSDSELNKEIVNQVIGNSMNLLQRSNATGVFLVLDGPAAKNSSKDTKAGFYVRGLNGGEVSRTASSLLLERGLPSLSKTINIPLDSFWELGFDVSAGDQTTDYYCKPFDSAVSNHGSAMEFGNYAYLSSPFRLTPMDLEIMTYSVPVILEDGTVVGVFGMDMTVAKMQRLLDAERTDSENDETYMVAKLSEGTTQLMPVVVSGHMVGSYTRGEPLTYTFDAEENVNLLETADGTSWYASIKKLDIYNYNTPFSGDEWVLVGLSKKSDLLSFYHTIRTMLLTSMLFPLGFSLIVVAVIGKLVTDPIRSLVLELRSKSGSHGLALKRVNIGEIDELTETIEKLSADVERSASKISSILENANVAIGVFECSEETGQVFISRTFCDMLGWDLGEGPYHYLGTAEFERRFHSSLKLKNGDKNTSLFYTTGSSVKRYMRLNLDDHEEHTLMGVLTDITADEEEKLKLEWERNYDLLTAIFNRRAFRERAEAILVNKVYPVVAVVMWDLDNLKYINDTYGHDDGDRYIVSFAQCLRELEQNGGIISRYAGDEFVTLLYDENGERPSSACGGNSGKEAIRSRIGEFMRKIQNCVLKLDENCEIPLRASGGVAWYPDDAGDFATLFNYADFAMYMVKHSVKGIVMEFDQKEYSSKSYMLAGREELNCLLEEGTVRFAFQPIVGRRGDVYGYELLMRPEFTNLKGINEVLNLARAQAKLPQMEGLTWKAGLHAVRDQSENGALAQDAKLFINSIASVCMTAEDEMDVEVIYKEFLSRIVIEMTESEPMNQESITHKKRVNERWNSMIAIDDYGAGYNGESILLDIEPDIVKVDIHLIRRIDEDLNRQSIVKSLIAFARANNILVLAEGVETVEELELLIQYGVDLFQGFYIGRPYMEIRPVDSYIIGKMSALAEKYNV